MANLTDQKRKQIEDYHSVGMSAEEISGKSGIELSKVQRIIQKLPQPLRQIETGRVSSQPLAFNISLLDTVDAVLPEALWILNRTLQKHKETDDLPPLRDTTNLVKGMMEIRGKITGETSGDIADANTIRSKTMGDIRRVLSVIPQNLKTLTGYSDVIELEKYEVKQIE